MSRVISTWREPANIKVFKPTGKEPQEEGFTTKESAYWMFAGKVEDILGPEGGTTNEIYYKVARPLGLSSQDTSSLIVGARKSGYLR